MELDDSHANVGPLRGLLHRRRLSSYFRVTSTLVNSPGTAHILPAIPSLHFHHSLSPSLLQMLLDFKF